MVSIKNRHNITTERIDGIIKFKDTINQFEFNVKLSPNVEITDEGYLIARNAVVGNVGELHYSENELGWSNSNRKVRVLRDETDVFDEDSLASLEGKPITILHPKGNVDSKTFKDLGHGTVLGKPRREGDNMVVDIIIHSQELVDLVAPEKESGIRELNESFRDLSLGYKAKLVEIALGLYKQTEIRYNHLAVVPEGRQANATIRDEINKEIEKEVEPNMGIIDKLFRKGKKVVRDENGEIKITNEVIELLLDEEEEKVEENKTQFAEEDKKEQVEDQDEKEKKDQVEKKDEKEKVEEEKKTMVKDKKYFEDELIRLNALPDSEIKVSLLQELDKEFLDAFPRPKVEEKKVEIKDSLNAVKSEELDKHLKDEKPIAKRELRFDEVAQFKAEYYRNLTDPQNHKDWKAFNDNYANEQRKGRSMTNIY